MATNLLPEGFVVESEPDTDSGDALPEGFVIEEPSSDISFINRGIARSFGAPVDIVNEMLGQVGGDEPFGGSKSLAAGLRALGFGPREGEEPQGLGANIAQGVGDVAGGLVPAAPLLKATQAGRGIVSAVADAPIKAAVGEIVAGAGSGAGGFIAEQEAPDSPAARALGEIAGGVSPAVLGRILVSAPSAIALRSLRKTFAPFTQSGARIRSERRARSVAADPARAVQELDETALKGTLSDISPAQQSGDKGLLTLEKAIRAKNADLDSRFQLRIENAEESLIGSLSEPGTVQTSRQLIEGRREALKQLMDARVKQAALAAEKRISDLGVDVTESQISIAVKAEIDEAFSASLKQERELWGLVPDTVKADPSSTRGRMIEIYKKVSRTEDPANIPSFVKQFLGKGLSKNGSLQGGKFIKKKQSVQELQDLRSRILLARREEAGAVAPSGRKISILDDLADSLVDDINTAAGGNSFDEARAFSSDLSQKFRRGAVGRIMGFERTGGPRIEPEAALRSAIGPTGPSGEAGLRQVMAATDASPEARDQVRQFILKRFNDTHIREGQIVGSARGFVTKNEGVLREFPETKRQIENAIDAQILARARQKTGASRAQQIRSNKSDTQRFLKSRVGEEIDTVFSAQNPARTARNLMNSVRGNREATEGIRAAMAQGIIKKVRTGQQTVNGLDVLSARKLANFLKEPRNKRAIDTILGSEKRNRLVRVQKELQKIENAQSAAPRPEGVISDIPNSILSAIARISGAQAGRVLARRTGGGTVQTPGIISSGVNRLLSRISNDQAEAMLIRALTDESPELLRSLLTDITKTAGREKAFRKIGAFLAGPSATLVEEDE